MFEKDLRISYLLDVYGDLLTDRKAEVLDMYYNEDFSLSEVAEQVGISRQGARDLIRKGQEELLFFEEQLGLAERISVFRGRIAQLEQLARNEGASDALVSGISSLSDLFSK